MKNAERKAAPEAETAEDMGAVEAQEADPETPEQPQQEPAPEAAAPDAQATQATQAMQADLEKARALADEYLTLAQRVQADFDNFRRRNESVRADAYSDGQRNVAAAMLPVLDNLERALDAAGEDSPLKSGVELTLKQMRAAYEKLGVTSIDRLGEKFDPNLENAILQGEPDEGEPGTVCQVLQKGYMMGKNVLRHAMVKVVPD